MFIGHFAVALAGKKIDRRPSLGTMFLAAQWLDLLWPLLILTGIEKVTIAPGNTQLVPLNFEYYPWSHSMLMAIIWGILFAVIYYRFTKNAKESWLLGALVFSHWVLDWLTHQPDLQLTPFTETRTGLGLWNYPWIAVVLETGMFLLGAWLYITATKPRNRTGTWALWALLVFLLAVYFMNTFGPPPTDVTAIGWVGLSQWLIVAWGYWIDRNRTPVE